MRTGRIFWGLILVYIGSIVLLENFGVIGFSWHVVWKLWPILLIIWGANILVARNDNRHAGLLTGIVTLIGLVFMTVFGIKEIKKEGRWAYEESAPAVPDSDDWGSNENKLYKEEYISGNKKAVLSIQGGAGDFKLEDTTAVLMEALVKGKNVSNLLKRVDIDSIVNLTMTSQESKRMLMPGDRFHKTDIKLNPNPMWDIHLKLGAADVDFDLKAFKIENLTLSGGAADIKVKVGERSRMVNIKAETGVSSVEIKVPENSGCRIVNKSGLSSKSFDDFIEIEKGVYESKNYKTAQKFVNIVLKSGISDLTVKTYKD